MTQDEAHQLWRYSQGKLYWLIAPNPRTKIGDEAGCVHGNGYREVGIRKKIYGVHRIVFLMFHGYIPKQVDHIDGNPLNNNVENLRAANSSTNGFNRKISVNNSSGVKNVSLCKAIGKWKVSLLCDGISYYYGAFSSLADAETMATRARLQLHGDFARNK
jgi:hypothetical protein